MDTVVIINRQARGISSCIGRAQGAGSLLVRELHRTRAGVDVVETNSLEDLADLARSMAAASAPPKLIVLVGGDGSHMAGVSALTRAFGRDRELPHIALAGGGTVNTVARNWGLPRSRSAQATWLRALLDAPPDKLTVTRRPTLRIVASEETNAECIGFIFGAGLVARFFDVYEARGATGMPMAARIVARIFAGSFVGASFAKSVLDAAPCAIEVDGVKAPFDSLSLLCASVVRDLGLHMHLLYRAAEEEDRFHLVATSLGPQKLGPQMPRVLAGRPLRGDHHVIDSLTAHVSLRFPKGAGAYVLDGDLFRADAIEVTAGPVLSLATPPKLFTR